MDEFYTSSLKLIKNQYSIKDKDTFNKVNDICSKWDRDCKVALVQFTGDREINKLREIYRTKQKYALYVAVSKHRQTLAKEIDKRIKEKLKTMDEEITFNQCMELDKMFEEFRDINGISYNGDEERMRLCREILCYVNTQKSSTIDQFCSKTKEIVTKFAVILRTDSLNWNENKESIVYTIASVRIQICLIDSCDRYEIYERAMLQMCDGMHKIFINDPACAKYDSQNRIVCETIKHIFDAICEEKEPAEVLQATIKWNRRKDWLCETQAYGLIKSQVDAIFVL